MPETARICRVTHAPGTAPSLAPLDGEGAAVSGAAAISAHLRELNADARGANGCVVAFVCCALRRRLGASAASLQL